MRSNFCLLVLVNACFDLSSVASHGNNEDYYAVQGGDSVNDETIEEYEAGIIGQSDASREYASDDEKPKQVFLPVYVPEKVTKKKKVPTVDKGFYIPGGTQLAGKFKSLKHCMKACALTPSCFAGDFNPWLHKCYQHTNFTACSKHSSHPQYVHFSKVPCSITDAPQGHVTLGASSIGGIEIKGIESLTQCIKKCTNAGTGIQATVMENDNNAGISSQSCFAIDYDFSTHKCFFFGSNYVITVTMGPIVVVPIHCLTKGKLYPTSQNARPNPNVIHMTFCPTIQAKP